MPQINTPTLRHLAPPPSAGWQWLAFTDSTYRLCAMHALSLIGERMKGRTRCSAAFQMLPGGRSFADLWWDRTVWISYDPGNLAGRFAARAGNELTISRYACRAGIRTVAAAVIHEMTQLDAADGISREAEQTLLQCLLLKHYDPVLACRLW